MKLYLKKLYNAILSLLKDRIFKLIILMILSQRNKIIYLNLLLDK